MRTNNDTSPTRRELRLMRLDFSRSLVGSIRDRSRGARKHVPESVTRQSLLDARIIRCDEHGLQCWDGHCPICEKWGKP